MKSRVAQLIRDTVEEAGQEDFLKEGEQETVIRFVQNTYEMPTTEEQEVHEIIERLMPSLWKRATRKFLS